MICTMRNFSFLIKSNSVLISFHFLICWLFWKSWPTKLIPLADNDELKIVLSSILIYLLCHKHWVATDEDKDGRDEKCFSHLIYEFWYDYIKPKYGDRAKLCYIDTDSFAILIKTEYFYKDIANDVEKWFDTSNYDENKTGKRPLPIAKNKKVISLINNK